METPLNNFVSDVAEGTVTSVIKNTLNGMKNLALKFSNRQLLFIGDSETIQNVKDQLKTNEESFYRNYIEDKEMRILILMGLAMRKMDKPNNFSRRKNLREKISHRFKREGLRLAYLSQNGILSRYINILFEKIESQELLKDTLVKTLKDIERYVCFVTNENTTGQIIEIINVKVISNSPEIFIISGMGEAKNTIKQVYDTLSEIIKINYSCEINSTEKREIIFLTKREERIE